MLRHKLKNTHRIVRNNCTSNRRNTIILFDHFGVVGVDPLRGWIQSHQLDVQQQEIMHAICDLIDAGEIELEDFYARLGELTGQNALEIQAELEKNSGYNRELLTIIKQLRKVQNIRIGLISNAHRSLHKSLWHDNIHPLFDDVITSQEISQVSPKPSPDFFNHAINRLGGAPMKTLLFDDRQANIDGASAIGIDAHLFTTAAQCKVDLHTHRIFD